jgi:hypothetical protein
MLLCRGRYFDTVRARAAIRDNPWIAAEKMGNKKNDACGQIALE